MLCNGILHHYERIDTLRNYVSSRLLLGKTNEILLHFPLGRLLTSGFEFLADANLNCEQELQVEVCMLCLDISQVLGRAQNVS